MRCHIPHDLTKDIRASLEAKLERLIANPLIASVPEQKSASDEGSVRDSPDVFRALLLAAQGSQPRTGRSGNGGSWGDNGEDGTCTVTVRIDYRDRWRGKEKEILEIVRGTVESPVTFLTNDQKVMLERTPRDFLALNPRPEAAELVTFRTEDIGGSEQVVELTVAVPPASPNQVRYIAIVPNLVQIERQLDALDEVERASDDGSLGPLRALVGLSDCSRLHGESTEPVPALIEAAPGERLDEFQAACIQKALATPHFAVIQGPPGSGKTTVITSIIRRSVAADRRVLVVSPTHVAVDNVVEKLVPRSNRLAEDFLEPHTLPVRYAARKSRLSDRAAEYWVGNKQQLRAATLSRRLQSRLAASVPIAPALYAKEDAAQHGVAPLSAAIAAIEKVICGTPIGILSYVPVSTAGPGEFDLLIVDEVSKMTLPEFLAIAVKAKRWVLVGDPQQLPPFNSSEENAPTLDDVLSPQLELVCSVGGILERSRPQDRRLERLLVIAADPSRVAEGIRTHIKATSIDNAPPVSAFVDGATDGVLVCSQQEVEAATSALLASQARDHTISPEYRGMLRLLVQRGLRVPRPEFASGARFVEPRQRSQALVFENAFNVYHAQPWSERSDQKLPLVGFRNGIEKYLPSAGAVEVIEGETDQLQRAVRVRAVRADIAARFAVNTVSVYDWLTGIPSECFDVSPLKELQVLSPRALAEAVAPFAGTLKKQYRMHASLSEVPRNLFYFGDALHDGNPDGTRECRVVFVQVAGDGPRGSETNALESQRICTMLEQLNAGQAAQAHRPAIMVVTPYREQRAFLAESIDELRRRGRLDSLEVDAYTLDSCQGREAEYVFVSLVRDRATPFFDMPKRWNVALTRAMQGLFIVGNIDAYLQEAARARRDPRNRPAGNGRAGNGRPRPLMSLLARIMESYDRQLADAKASGT